MFISLKLINQFYSQNSQKIPKSLDYAIRFRTEDDARSHWQAAKLQELDQCRVGPRSPDVLGGPPYYVARCFSKVQNLIDREFIKLVAENDNLELPNVSLQRYPTPPYSRDDTMNIACYLLPLFITIGFVYAINNITKVMVNKINEKSQFWAL